MIDGAPGDERRGSFYVSVTKRRPDDGSNAETVRVGYWPGTKAGLTPPSTWEDAFVYAMKTVRAMTDLPGGEVCEIRITTFAQGEADDYFAERSEDEE